MKNKIKIFLLLVFGVITISCLLIAQIINNKNQTESNINTLPNFSYLTLQNTPFLNLKIDPKKPRIIINHFSPNCEHCLNMTVDFIKNSKKFMNIQILMITSADSLATAKFNNDFKISLLPNFVILRDTNFQFQRTFGTGIVPSFFIYEHNKLIKKVIGETKIDNLIN